MPTPENSIIIYNTLDGKAAAALYAKDGKTWLNQKQVAKLFATSVPYINTHISNMLVKKGWAKIQLLRVF